MYKKYKNYSIVLKDKRMDSFGVRRIDFGAISIGFFVYLHGLISNFDIISASPVLASINANLKPI